MLGHLICGLLVVAAQGSADGGSLKPWQQALHAAEEFEVVSVVDRLDAMSLMRTNLLGAFPLKVHLLGLEPSLAQGKWVNLRKLMLLHDHVLHLPAGKIVFFIDFFDVVWLHCHRDLIDTFRRFDRPLVLSAELFASPVSNTSLQRLSGGYPFLPGLHWPPASRLVRQGGRTYRYLNSGCIAGYAGALVHATERMLAHGFDNEYVLRTPLATTPFEREQMQVGIDDQIAWHTYALKHRDEVALDYGADLFFSAQGFSFRHFDLRMGEIWARPFNRAVCFAHGNGATNLAILLKDAQLLGARPQDCWEGVSTSRGQQVFHIMCRGRHGEILSA